MVSHYYKKYSEVLNNFNTWLLCVKEMRDGYIPHDESALQMPNTTRLFLVEIVNQTLLNDLYTQIYRRWLNKRIDSDILKPLLAKPYLTLADFDNVTISALESILVALDVMVCVWWHKGRIRHAH